MLYSYQKATPDFPSPGKVIPRHLKFFPVLMSSLGLGLVASVVWPIVSYQITYFFNSKYQELTLLSPAVYESFANETDPNANAPTILSDIDYTKASNWFSFTPEANLTQVPQDSQSEFISLGQTPTPAKELVVSSPEYDLSIPVLGIKQARVRSDSDDLNKSLVQFKNTAEPGQFGSPVIIGHSTLPQFFNATNYLTIFATLPTIKLGSDIMVTYAGVQYTYRISNMYEVKPTDIWVLKQDYSKKTIKLVTCVPPGTTLRRLIIEADLIST